MWQKITDILLVIVGVVAMGYTTALTIINWSNSSGGQAPGYCDDVQKSW